MAKTPAPTGIKVKSTDYESIVVEFTPGADDPAGGDTAYTIAVYDAADTLVMADYHDAKYAGAAQTYNFPGTRTNGGKLLPDTDYTLKMSVGWQPSSGEQSDFVPDPGVAFKTKTPTVLDAPTPTNDAAVTSTTEIGVEWTAVNNADGYSIKIGTGAFETATGTKHTFSGLTADTNHTITIKATSTNIAFSDSPDATLDVKTLVAKTK